MQLWTALPDEARSVAPHFEHHPDLPVLADSGATITVIMGELAGQRSPAQVYSPLVGAEAVLAAGADARLPLRPDWEYAALALAGEAEVDGVALAPGPLLYLGLGRSELTLRADRAARLLLIGGEPFAEHLVMWWNFVGRDHEDIVEAREQWMAADRPVRPGPGLPRCTASGAADAEHAPASHAGDSGNILHSRPARLSLLRPRTAAVCGPDH